MVLTDRDKLIIYEIARWRGCLGRHVKVIGSFGGMSPTNRRLKKLVDNSFLTRKKYIYALPSIYQVTPFAKRFLNLDTYIGKVKLEQAEHDMTVVDTYLYLKEKYKLSVHDVISEKELRHEHGFIVRGHAPDFIYKTGDEVHCVEVELSQKAKERLEANVQDNYIKYVSQKWVVPKNNHRVIQWLNEMMSAYPNIEMIDFREIHANRCNH